MDTTAQKHSGMGITSFVISVFAGALMFASFVGSAVVFRQHAPGTHVYAAGQLVVGFALVAATGLEFLAAGLGIASVCQSGKKRTFGILGLVFSGLLILSMVGLFVFALIASRHAR